MKEKLIGFLGLWISALSAGSHPGVGIVQDSRGNIFFTDLKQVWKITPEGGKSVAVPRVHTHELCLDANDNLFGEHLWFKGDASQAWGHRVWCLKRDGSLGDVIPARKGFLQDYSFVRDRAGAMYWADRTGKIIIRKRSVDGRIVTLSAGDFRAVQWLVAQPDGTIFLMDGGDLRRISPDGEVRLVVSKLSGRHPPPPEVSELNYHMGLWIDRNGGVYVAIAAERLVLRVARDGTTSVAARSPEPWSPSGGTLDRDGSQWLLEYDPGNDVRARHIDLQGHDHIYLADGVDRDR